MPTPRCEPLPRSTGTIWLSSSASRGRVAWLSRTASTTPSLRCAAARPCSPPPTHLSRAELTRRRAGGVPPRVPAAVPGHPAPLHLSDPVPVRAAKPHPTPSPPAWAATPVANAFRLFGSPDAVGSYQDLWYISGPSEEEANKLRQPVAAILIVADPIPCTLAPRYRCGRLPSQPTGICFAQGDATCRSASIFSARTATRMSARTRKGWPATSPAATWNMPPSGTILGWAMAPSPSRSRRSTSSSTESLCRRRCSVGTHRRSAQRKQHRQPLPCSLGIERANRRR